ncbi:mechanosensitive ion channel family protein [Puniceicoccales bacterium CK1056]|uniref:Mechanosensitive ion channel family protein n=1 Tax=Oceanipulchritudo coccoides TaxID=2706888 RepID=A0A6B2M389_9BACT|nr:mechanosensitive ion channel family protein [Oceanipulchritudo coccoides]NDV63428.1 mechanosensitive ion channel family protein [Oceanipulchritudo coccoides]
MEEELEKLQGLKDQLILYLVENGMRLFLAVVIILVGFWVGKSLSKLILKICDKRGLDVTLARFFAGFTKLIVIVFAVIIALSKAGIEITPFVALLGASAFGLSLAVQGPISNYGAGIVLIVTRPFKVGDTLSVSGQSGIVDNIALGHTQLYNEDDEKITIPNRKVLGEIFVNSQEFKIVEGVVGIAYSEDPEAAIRCVRDAIHSVKEVAPDRQPDVGIDAFADSSINIGYRVWVPTQIYHKTRYGINLAIFQALQKENIAIPFPQRDIHIINKEV